MAEHARSSTRSYFVYAKVDIREKTVKTIQNRTTSDPCSTDPCLNDGYSSVDDNFDPGSKCRCPFGFSGDLCKITSCSRDPCQNDGNCSVSDNSYICECLDGFSGNSCEITPCSSNPCENGGTCVQFVHLIAAALYIIASSVRKIHPIGCPGCWVGAPRPPAPSEILGLGHPATQHPAKFLGWATQPPSTQQNFETGPPSIVSQLQIRIKKDLIFLDKVFSINQIYI